MAHTQTCQFQKCNDCLVNFMSAILNFVHDITDLSIAEGFFNKIMDLYSALLYLRDQLNEENWFTFGLPRPQLSVYANYSKW